MTNQKERYTISYSSPYFYLYDEETNELMEKSYDRATVVAEKKKLEEKTYGFTITRRYDKPKGGR